ncbi:MAG: FG-GAP repeat protein [Alphaproteobacteria bacterium]|nr:FG-GAP repeat protein [Alphaproteobacteria bacterium]
MARDTDTGLSVTSSDPTSDQIFSAHDQTRIEVGSAGFTSDALITRDGQDLVLTNPAGERVVVEGYFIAEPTPVIHAPDGSVLTPGLVNSFVQSAPEYAQTQTATDESPIGAVQEIKGEAFVTRADGTREPMTLGTPVYEGDVVETSQTGAVNIVFLDNTSLAVSENARAALDTYQFDPATEGGAQDISVLRGVFVFTSGLIGRDDPDDVKIETPVGSIGIRGTIIAGDINPDGKSAVSVLEGAIVIKNDISEVVLTQQYETVKLSGQSEAIENIGVMKADDIRDTFGAVSDVIPTLFSTLESSAQKQDFTVQPASTTNESPADSENIKIPTDEAPDNVLMDDGLEMEIPTEENPDNVFIDDTLMMETGLEDNLLGDIIADANTKTVLQTLSEADKGTNNISTSGTKIEFTPEVRNFLQTLVNPDVIEQNKNSSGTQNNNTGVFSLDLNSATSAQGVTRLSDNIGNRIGYSLSSLGDVNRDGYADFIFSNNTNAGGQNHSYAVYGSSSGIASGLITSVIDWNIADSLTDIDVTAGDMGVISNLGGATAFQNSTVTGIGDFDGDGLNDYLIGQPFVAGTGSAMIVSGNSNSSFISLTNIPTSGQAGYSVTALGDINHDGRADVLIGAPGTTQGQAYLIYGGAAYGTPLNVNTLGSSGLRLNGTNPGDAFGSSVTGIGDFNGDGYQDFAIGSPGSDTGGTDRGRVEVFSGQNPSSFLFQFAGDYNGELFGKNIKNIGDFNGDGRSDFIAAGDTPNISGDYTLKLFTHNGSTATQETVLTISQEILGGGGVGDWNGDGFDDFSVALKNGSNADIYVVYGRSGSTPSYTLSDLQNSNLAYKMTYQGISGDVEISNLGDVNGDGYDDMGVGLPEAEIGNGGNPDGQVIIVNGRNSSQATSSYVGTDGDDTFNSLPAGGFSASGGAGDDTFLINNTAFRSIDGGLGDGDSLLLNAGASLDFSTLNFEHISQIEKIILNSGSMLTLSIENIFNMLQTSDLFVYDSDAGNENRSLVIKNISGSTENLNLEASSATGATTGAIISALNERTGEIISHDIVNYDGYTYQKFTMGNNTLYIESDINVNVV